MSSSDDSPLSAPRTQHLGDELQADLDGSIVHAKAAYASATDWLTEHYLPNAPEGDSVGRDRYVASAEQFLGESIDPEADLRVGLVRARQARRAPRRVVCVASTPTPRPPLSSSV